MNFLLKRSVLMLAVTMLATAGTTNRATAQVVIDSASEIVQPGIGELEAYYEAATGEVYLAAGEGLLIAGVTNADFLFENLDNSSGVFFEPPLIGEPLPPPFAPTTPSGIFNIGDILPADPSITNIPSFLARFGDVDAEGRVGTAGSVLRWNWAVPTLQSNRCRGNS